MLCSFFELGFCWCLRVVLIWETHLQINFLFLKKVKLCILFQVFLACLVVVCLDSMVVWHYLWWLGDSRSMFMFFFPSFWDVYFIDVYLFIFGFGRINLIYCVPLGLSIFSFHMWKYYFGKLVMCKPFNISIDGVGAGLRQR